MALASGLAYLHVLMVDIADLADRCHAGLGHVAKLARREPQKRHAVLLCHQLGHNARGPCQLGPLAGVQLHVVDEGAGGDVLQGQGVAGLDIGLGPGALEIDYTVLLAVCAAAMADGYPAVAVAAGLVPKRSQQALLRAALREDGIVRNGHVPARRGSRLIILYCHVFCSPSR